MHERMKKRMSVFSQVGNSMKEWINGMNKSQGVEQRMNKLIRNEMYEWNEVIKKLMDK